MRKNLYLFCYTLFFCALYINASAQSSCEPNIDFELGTTSYWNYWRGTNTLVGTNPIWTFASCAPSPGLHTLESSLSATDYYGGFPVVGEGLYSLKIGKDSGNTNADAVDYHIHVPNLAGTEYALIYRYAIVLENPGHSWSYYQPRFEISVTDSATGAAICGIITYVGSGSLPAFKLSTVTSTWSGANDVWTRGWTPASFNLTGLGGKTLIVKFSIGGCTLGCHFGYAYIDMNCGWFKSLTVGCSGGSATLAAPPAYPAGLPYSIAGGPFGYNWTDSLTFTASYGTTQTITVSVPTVTTTYAVIITPYPGLGCVDTFYTRLIPSNMVTHQAHDTTICYGASVRIWGGATDILPLTYSWTPATGLSCTTCDTAVATPPVGLNSYKITTYNTGGCLQTDTINVTVLPIPAAISGNLNVCLGLTSGLSDAVAGGGWTSSNTTVATIGSASGIVTGNSIGTATITYSFKGLCPVYATVTVNSLPSPITGAPVLCVGYTTSLTDGPGAGTWSSSNTSIATIGTSSGIVTGMSGGTSIITWTQSSATCWTTRTVTVAPSPGIITGVTTICNGSTSTLTGGIGGTWASSNTSVAIIGTGGVVTGVSPGTATISYTIGLGCYVTTLMTVLLTPLPITGASIVCSGYTSSLSDATPGGLWVSSDKTVATVGSTSGLVSGIAPVSAIISYSLPSGCRATLNVTVNPVPNPISGILNVCAGQTTGLSDTLTGGTWTSGNPAIGSVDIITGIVAGISPGTFTITYAITATGCYKTTVIAVNPNPAIITGLKSICLGNTTNLSDATPGGTWSSDIPSVADIGSASGIVTAISAGTTTISYTLGTGCAATTIVTVNPTPGAITGALKVCVGSTNALSDAAIGGTWTSSNITIAAIGTGTGVVSGLSAGTATITYTLGTGCNTSSNVTVNPLPTISGATGLCVGTMSTLSNSIAGGMWSSGNTAVATVSLLGSVRGIAPGTAVISYKIFSTGCIATTTVNITSTPGSISGIANVCAGTTTTLSDPAIGGTWTSSNTAIASVTSGTGVVTGIAAGTATIVYSLGAGCTVSQTVTVNNAPTPVTGSAAVCIGGTIILSDGVSSGTWTSSNTGVATISSGGMVSGIVPGTTTISYTLTGGCAATKTITAQPTPTAISGPATVCVGSIITLSDAIGGGSWACTLGGIVSVGTATGIVTGLTAGTATITYSLGVSCAVGKMVTVNATPAAITGASNICVGTIATLSNSAAGGTWNSTDPTVSVGITSGILSGVSAGTATITYTLGTGCSVSKSITVNPLPAAITGTTNVCVGQTTNLSDVSIGGTWSTTYSGIATVAATTGIVTGISAGTAIITYALGTGCISSTAITVNALPAPITGPPMVCESATIILNDLTTGGTWSSSNTSIVTISAGGMATGISGGIVNITYSLGSGCMATDMVVVGSVSAITGATMVCAGDITTLSDAVTGGAWSGGGGIVTIGMSSGIVTGLIAGTTIITYTTPLGCKATAPLMVNALPTAGIITGASNVCAGSTVMLSDAATGGSWSSPDYTVSVGALSGLVTGIAVGTATISYRNTNLCGTAVATHAMTVNPLPLAGTITGDTTVCVGSVITMSDTSFGGIWSSPDLTVNVGSVSGLVTGISMGTATITYSITNMCGTANVTYAVSINPLPVAGAIVGAWSVCKDATTALTDSVAGGIWLASNSNATVSGGIITGISAGRDTILYITTNSCGTASTMHIMTINPLPFAGFIIGPSSVCVGTNISLTDPATGGVWDSHEVTVVVGAATGIVTGISAGAATISYSVANMCGTDIATHIVTINPQPFAGTITGAGSVCAGLTVALTDTISGGNWTSSNTLTAVTNGIVNALLPGTDTIKYSVSNVCGTDIAKHILTVNPQPQAGTITGAANVCIGSPITWSDDISGGVWSSVDNIVKIDAVQGIITGVAAGTASITYSVTNMCGTATTEKTINVIPLPTASEIIGASNVCQGASITLTDFAVDGTWSSTNNLATVSNGLINGVVAGVDTILYTVSNLCGASTVAKAITVNPLPDAGVITGSSSICPRDTAVITNTIIGGAWSNTNSSVLNLVPQTNGAENIIGVASGIDTIVYTVTNSCGIASAKFPFAVRPVSACDSQAIQRNEFDCSGNGELIIYPNPNPGVFTINIVSDIQEDVSIVIANMLGQRLKILASITNKPLEIELNEPPGVYIVSMLSTHGKCSKKVWLKP